MSWLRFIAGLGIGGVIPNIVAINAESARANKRATLAIIATGMVPLGGASRALSVLALWRAMAGKFCFRRRHRADRVRAGRDLLSAQIDQVHGDP